jgi:hypothetical protein
MIRRRRSVLVLFATALTGCGGNTDTQPRVDSTAVARITIRAPHASLAVGSTLQLAADAANSAGTILANQIVDWSSSRPEIATVTSFGLVTGVAVGTAVITARSGGHSGSATMSVQAPTQIILISDPGDYIGAGGTYGYSNTNAVIAVSATTTLLQLSISGDEGWIAGFKVPSGAQLSAGAYSNATRWPFQGTGAGLSWGGQGRGCNTLTGSFTIDSLSWTDELGSALLAVDLRFEQHCEGTAPALRGSIHWRADDPTVAPGPVLPIPANLWQPPSGAVPATGDVTYLQSEPGDYIGGGATNLYQSNMRVTGNGRHATVSVGGYTGDFEGMGSIPELKVGYYGNLMRYPFNNPARGGLSWYGNGVGCNTLTGWFVVDRVHYANFALLGIELRFEQHCDGQTAALHGMVRWGQFAG